MKRKLFLAKLIATVCALPCLSRLARARPEVMTDLNRLENDYYRAASALKKYREACGFLPGVRVRAHSRWGGALLLGTIAPYGARWSVCMHTDVPVMLDKGYCQVWSMSDLTAYCWPVFDSESGK